MKRALALITVALMAIICIIPIADSSDATGDTTISAKFFCDRDLSTVTTSVSVVYYNGTGNGTLVGSTSTVSAKDASGFNKFSVPIEPGELLVKSNYYFFINIEGFSVVSTSSAIADDPIEIKVEEGTSTVVTRNCYQITSTGTFVANIDNDTGGVITMARESLGSVTGFVMIDTKEPIYLNNVSVILYDIATGESLIATTTSDKGSYTIDYNPGTYRITFELGGYKTQSADVTIKQNETTTLNIHMEQGESYFGLDLPHALMIIGGSVAITLILFALFMRVRLARK